MEKRKFERPRTRVTTRQQAANSAVGCGAMLAVKPGLSHQYSDKLDPQPEVRESPFSSRCLLVEGAACFHEQLGRTGVEPDYMLLTRGTAMFDIKGGRGYRQETFLMI